MAFEAYLQVWACFTRRLGAGLSAFNSCEISRGVAAAHRSDQRSTRGKQNTIQAIVADPSAVETDTFRAFMRLNSRAKGRRTSSFLGVGGIAGAAASVLLPFAPNVCTPMPSSICPAP